MYKLTVMLSCIGLGRGLLSLGLVLILSWSCLGVGLVFVLSWSCLGFVFVLSCLGLVLVLSWLCLGLVLVLSVGAAVGDDGCIYGVPGSAK